MTNIRDVERGVLVEAISWSNANLHFADCATRTDNTTDQYVAIAILQGLDHLGWKLVPK